MSYLLSNIECISEALRFATVLEDAALEAELNALEELPVGPELARRLAALPTDDPRLSSDPHQRVRVAGRWAALATWAEANSLREVAAGASEVDDLGAALGHHLEAMNFRSDLALQTQNTEAWADRQIDFAAALAERLPVLADTLALGGLTMTHARRLADVLDAADSDTARQIDRAVTPKAVVRRWTPSEYALAARRMLLLLDLDGGAHRHDEALDRRSDVTGGGLSDGLGWLAANGDALTIADILATVDTRADQLATLAPDTPAGRLRLAALGDLVLGQDFTLLDHVLGTETADPDRPAESADSNADDAIPARRRPSRRREVIVTVDLLTLLGLRDNPAELAGYGPIPARIARLLATETALRRLVNDPVTGQPLHLDRRSRIATDPLVTAIRAVQGTCQFPGCTRAHVPDLDHRTDWPQGGATNADNLQLLCKRHHALKTAGLWSCHPQPDGSTIWAGPDGQEATRHPDRHTG